MCLGYIIIGLLVLYKPAQAYPHKAPQDIYAVQIDLIVNNRPLADVFELIERKTDFTFTYSSRQVDVSRTITLTGKQKNLGTLLEYIAGQHHLVFKRLNQTLMVKTATPASAHLEMGAVKGHVVDALTREPLPGATVTIQGTSNGTATDLNGDFLLRTMPGQVTLEVRYIGFQMYATTVTVAEKEVTDLIVPMQNEITELQDVVITGVLQGQQRALNQQRAADNIKNIVSADQIGRFPDPNVAEALQRIPAVNIERDQGEGRYVLVRGLAPQFTNISINGEQVPSPEAGVRYVALDAVPADQLASIEVSKTITPDMDGDAIGGSVNLITRKAQTEALSVKSTGVLGYNHISGKPNFQGSLELSQRFLDNKLGIMVNGSYYETERGSDNWERDDTELELRDYLLTRTRTGLSSTIDYKFTDQHEVYLRTIYNRFTDREQRRRYVFKPDVDESPFEDNEIERLTKDRLEKQMVSSINLGAKHTFPLFSLDYEVSYAEAVQDTPFDLEIASVAAVDQLAIDFDTNPEFPSFTVNDLPHTNPANDYLNNTFYEFDEFSSGNTYAKDVNKTAKANVTIPYLAGKHEGAVKFGGKVRLKEKSYDIVENVFSYTGDEDLTLDQYDGGTVDHDFLGNRYRLSANADPEKFVSYFNDHKDAFELDVEDKLAAEAVEAYTANEDVYAGYLMTRLQLNKLMLLGGVRYEQTQVSYRYEEVIYDYEGDLESIEPQTGSTDYTFILPQVHVKYQVDNHTNVRAAVTRSYARPNFEDIVPSVEIELSEREGTIGNANLKPVSAWNVDLLGEHYFGTVGILSGGLFYKRLGNFIFQHRFETDSYPGTEGADLTLTQAQNGDDASLAGFEIAYQQKLSFLPACLKNISVYTNYTFTHSNATIQSREEDEGTENIRLPGQAKHVGNVSLGYDVNRLNFRISANFNGAYMSEVGGDASEDLYVADRMQLDATATMTLTPKLRIFTEFLNITNQPFEVYQGSEDFYIQREFYAWWTRLGLKLDL